jgi:hypothetical protein
MMNENNITPLQERTDAKLRYAEIHLDELKSIERLGGDDFDRAHQESFLYHLLGAKDAFLIELNTYYAVGLGSNGLSIGKLRRALKDKGRKSGELAELYKLENDERSWLFDAKAMRNHSTHVLGVKRHFHLGGVNDGKIFLTNPESGEKIERDFIDDFNNWLHQMRSLLSRLRVSAVDECQRILDDSK